MGAPLLKLAPAFPQIASTAEGKEREQTHLTAHTPFFRRNAQKRVGKHKSTANIINNNGLKNCLKPGKKLQKMTRRRETVPRKWVHKKLDSNYSSPLSVPQTPSGGNSGPSSAVPHVPPLPLPRSPLLCPSPPRLRTFQKNKEQRGAKQLIGQHTMRECKNIHSTTISQCIVA